MPLLYTSPSYLEQRGPILSVKAQWEQDAIIFRAGNGQLRLWKLAHEGNALEISPNISLIVVGGRTCSSETISGNG